MLLLVTSAKISMLVSLTTWLKTPINLYSTDENQLQMRTSSISSTAKLLVMHQHMFVVSSQILAKAKRLAHERDRLKARLQAMTGTQ